MNTQVDFFLGLTGLISLLSKGTLKPSPAPQFEVLSSSVLSLFYCLTSIHDYWRNHSLTIRTLIGKVIFVLFNTLSRFVIAFLPRSKHLLILWLQSHFTVILEPKENKSLSLFSMFPHLFTMKWWDQMPWSSYFECWALSQLFSLSSFTFIEKLFNSSSLSAVRVVSFAYLRLLIFLTAILIPVCASSSPIFHMM